MYCIVCGKQIDSKNKFCPYCGCRVEDDSINSTSFSNSSDQQGVLVKEIDGIDNSRPVLSILLIAASAVIVILVFLVIKGGPDTINDYEMDSNIMGLVNDFEGFNEGDFISQWDDDFSDGELLDTQDFFIDLDPINDFPIEGDFVFEDIANDEDEFQYLSNFNTQPWGGSADNYYYPGNNHSYEGIYINEDFPNNSFEFDSSQNFQNEEINSNYNEYEELPNDQEKLIQDMPEISRETELPIQDDNNDESTEAIEMPDFVGLNIEDMVYILTAMEADYELIITETKSEYESYFEIDGSFKNSMTIDENKKIDDLKKGESAGDSAKQVNEQRVLEQYPKPGEQIEKNTPIKLLLFCCVGETYRKG